MPEPDFDPQKEIREYDYWTGQRVIDTYHPTVGNVVVVVAVESTPDNASAINSLLNQIRDLSIGFRKRKWTPTAEDGRRPSVGVTIVARTDAPLE